MKKKRFGVSQALSRGLTEAINVVENNMGLFRSAVIPLSRIELDPHNPRQLAISLADIRHGLNKDDAHYEKKLHEFEKLKELAFTIEQSGLINPIVVYKLGEFYRIAAGERRFLASLIAKRTEIEARVYNEKPKGFDLKLIQWVENTAREDLTLWERIENIRDLVREYHHQHGESTVTASLLKKILGLSLSQASYYLLVLNAPSDLQKAIQHNEINSLDKAAIIAGISSDEVRHKVLEACLAGCNLKELRKMISESKETHTVTIHRSVHLKQSIQMGKTMNGKVVETIVKAVLKEAQFEQYKSHFSKVNWSNPFDSRHAFRRLLTILESEVT